MRDVAQSNEDVEAYIEARRAAYFRRWREATRHLSPGDKVLDLGGGNLWPELLRYIKSEGLNYWYLDVDPKCVASCKSLAISEGLDPSRFEIGFNDSLPFPDCGFDAVFTSHCLEHSLDLQATIYELWRVIRPGGALLMAVPLGWDARSERPYFLGPDEWVALTEDIGFELRSAEIGRDYPEFGYDLFVVARRVDRRAIPPRLSADDYRGTSYAFVSFDDPSISYAPAPSRRADHTLCDAPGWTIRISPPKGARVIAPVFARHPWSGVVDVACGSASAQVDLYSWFSYAQPLLLRLDAGDASLAEIRPLGRNQVSHAAQCALYGVMFG